MSTTSILLLVAVLLPAGASGQTCPNAKDLGQPNVDFVVLPEGCPAPVEGYFFTPTAYQQLLTMLATRKQRIVEEERLKTQARQERDECRVACLGQTQTLRAEIDKLTGKLREAGEALEKASKELMRCTDPPSRLTWGTIGAGVGVAICAGGVLLGASL